MPTTDPAGDRSPTGDTGSSCLPEFHLLVIPLPHTPLSPVMVGTCCGAWLFPHTVTSLVYGIS